MHGNAIAAFLILCLFPPLQKAICKELSVYTTGLAGSSYSYTRPLSESVSGCAVVYTQVKLHALLPTIQQQLSATSDALNSFQQNHLHSSSRKYS